MTAITHRSQCRQRDSRNAQTLAGSRLCSIGRNGFVITDLGKELFERIEGLPVHNSPAQRCEHNTARAEFGAMKAG